MKIILSNKIFIILCIILVFLLGLFFIFPKDQKVCDGKVCFNVSIAKNDKQREEGLMNVKSLDKNKGMLFVFDAPGKYSFWMKGTFIPLDIIWIGADKKIVDIKENAKPCQENCENFNPKSEAKYVLEINGGLSKDVGVKVGDKLKF